MMYYRVEQHADRCDCAIGDCLEEIDKAKLLEMLDLDEMHKHWKATYMSAVGAGPWHPKDKEEWERMALVAAVRAGLGLEIWAKS